MPLDALGDTRITILALRVGGTGRCDGPTNVESQVGMPHQGVPNVSLSLVHTARRYLRWSVVRTLGGVSAAD